MPVLQPPRALALGVCGYGIEQASGGVSRSVWRLILSSLLSMVRELVHTNSSSTPSCKLLERSVSWLTLSPLLQIVHMLVHTASSFTRRSSSWAKGVWGRS